MTGFNYKIGIDQRMRLTLPPVEPTNNNGFGSKADIFSREAFGTQITNFILNTDENLVLALDSNWGQGKSTFIKMWKNYNHSLSEPLNTIYFDAFENDYQQDAFLALASEVYDALVFEKESDKSEFKTKVAKVFKAFGRSAVRIGSKVATAGMVDNTVFDAAEDEISNLISGNVETYISNKLENTTNDKLALEEFRTFLTRVVQENTLNKKMVFIIDELDRCRPDFSLEIIEKIKHLFSVQGLTFILVMNRSQLEESVKCRYGAGIEAQSYLQKFINVWLKLPENRSDKFGSSDKVKFIDYAIAQMECRLLRQNRSMKSTIIELIEANNTSYREIERIMTQFAILQNVQKNVEEYEHPYQIAIAGLCFIKVNEPELYSGLINKKVDANVLLNRINIEPSVNTHSGTLANMIIASTCDDQKRKEMIEAKQVPSGRFGAFDPDIFVLLNQPMNNFTQV